MTEAVGNQSTWPLVLLEKLAQRGSGHTPNQRQPSYWNGGIKWVSLADSWRLDQGLIHDTEKQISELGIENSSAVLHPAGTVILSRDAGVGRSAILAEPMAVSQHFIVWRCGPELHNGYLYQVLQSLKPEFERIANGSTVRTIGLPYFKRLKVPAPPLIKQIRIAEALECWDRAVDAEQRLLEATDGRRRAIEQRFFERRNAYPTLRADALFNVHVVRATGTERLLSVTQDEGVVPRDEREGRVTMPTGDLRTFKRVQAGQFVISLRSFQGGVELCHVDGIVSPAYTVLAPGQKVHPGYFRHYFKSADFIRRLSVAVVGIRDGKQISWPEFRSIKLPLPSLEEQAAMARVLDTLARETTLVRDQIALIRQQKQALLHKLLWSPADAKHTG